MAVIFKKKIFLIFELGIPSWKLDDDGDGDDYDDKHTLIFIVFY